MSYQRSENLTLFIIQTDLNQMMVPYIEFTHFSQIEEWSTISRHPLYKATSKQTGSLLILKDFLGKNEHYNRESRILSLERHRCILKSEGFIPEQQVIALEFARNGDLCNLLMQLKTGLPKNLTKFIFREILEGLEHLHNNGFAHLDIKPDNIFIGGDYQVMIGDFDQSQNLSDNIQKASGSANWRAPEVALRQCRDYRAADIFSLGVMLYVMLSGKRPYGEVKNKNSGKIRMDENWNNLHFHPDVFWSNKDEEVFDLETRNLLMNMMSMRPEKRITIPEIKTHPWFRDFIEPEHYQFEMQILLLKTYSGTATS